MLQVTMPGEVLLSSDCQGGNFKASEEMDDSDRKLQEMAEKLEKAEAGRKKLRQAIAMLKEKMEATEKVLQVNETLRQECEKERMRAKIERKKAEEEKTLRLEIEKENLSIKEQLVDVLQRLDAVERNSKSDRAETLRVRSEMKQALSALSGALQVAEAAHSSVHGLEKFVQDKVNNSVSTSTRALSLAQSVTSDVKAAQGAAASAERTSKSLLSRLEIVQKQSAGLDQRVNLLQQETSNAVSLTQSVSADAKAAQVAAASAEKMSQSLVSRVASGQKQSASLDHRVNLLQQELRTRFVDVGATFNGARAVNAAVPCADKLVSNKGMVLSKSQQPIGAGVQIVQRPYRSSVAGSCDLSHDTVRREIVVGLKGLWVQTESHLLESTQLVDSGSSSGCTTKVSRELELAVKNKVSNPNRERSAAAATKRHSVTSPPLSTAAPRLQKPSNTPVSRSLHSRSAKCTSGQEGIKDVSKLSSEALGKANVDSIDGSFPTTGELCESRLSNTDVRMPLISATIRPKVLSKKCSAAGPINADFSGRQRVCGAVSSEDDKAHALPLRVTEAEKGIKALDVVKDKVGKGKRKVKLPAALLKDITKLFNKEKKMKARMEGKFMALEQLLRSSWESGTFSEQLSAQETRKRKRRQKMYNKNSNEAPNGDFDQESNKKSRLGTAPHIGVVQTVGDSLGGLGKRASSNKSKDGITGNPAKIGESFVAEISVTAKLHEQSGKEMTGGDSRAVSSVSNPDDGERCRGFEQLRKGMEFDKDKVSEGVKCCRDIDVDKGGTNEWTVTCSSGLPERAGMSWDAKEDDMDIDKGNGRPVHQIPEGTPHGWDTESDFSDDEFDPEWWTRERVLLSPTLPELQPYTLSECTPLDTGLVRPEPEEMSLEDIALFLDVLPLITGEGCEEEIKDVELQPLSETHTLDVPFSGNMEADISTSPKSGDVDVVGKGMAAQKEDVWEKSSPLLVSRFSSKCDPKIVGEDCCREEGNKGSMFTNIVEEKFVLNQQKLDNTGDLKVLGQYQTCILKSTANSELENLEANGNWEKDKENLVRDGTASGGSVQVTGMCHSDCVLLAQGTNIVPITGNSANLLRSLNCESGDEAKRLQDMESQVPILAATVDKLQISGMDGTLEKEDKEEDGTVSRGSVEVTGFRPFDSVILPQEANTVPIPGSCANLQKSLNRGSGHEANGFQDVETQIRGPTLSVDITLEILGMDGGLKEEDEESMIKDCIPRWGSVEVTGLQPSDTLLREKTNIVPKAGDPANLQRSLNCESGDDARGVQDLESQVCILTSGMDSKLKIPGVDGSLDKEDRENIVRDGEASPGSTQVGLRPSDPALLPHEINSVPITCSPPNFQRPLKCRTGDEAGGAEEMESTAKIEDGYPGAQCEGEAKGGPLFGLKLLAGFLGENTSTNSTEPNTDCRPQMLWRVGETASVVSRTRDCLVQALKHNSTCEVKSWIGSTELALSLAKTRLSGMNLLSIFTASLIDAYGWWESETPPRAPSNCRAVQYLLVLVSEVLKAEVFSRTFPSEFQIVDVLAYQLQEFLIQGTIRPVVFLEVKNTPWDCGEAVITFQIPSTTSDLERIKTVTSASKLLASLCLGTGKTDHLRKSIYLILRYCNMDGPWLLAAMSSIATVCGRQLFSASADDIAGQAVLVVISELLNDAERTEATGNETVLADSSSGNADDACEGRHEKNQDVGSRREVVVTSNFFSNNLHILRTCVGKFETYLNFEVLLPTILQSFFDVMSPNYFTTFSDSQHFTSDPACIKLQEQSGTAVGTSRVLSDSAASANTVDGASPQACRKVERKGMDGYCWQCSYSNKNGFRSASVKSMDTVDRSGDYCIAWDQKFHEITHALELVACHLGWEWTYNDLIVEHLWKHVYSGASDMTVAFIAKSLGIFGRLGIEVDGTELQGVEELRQILLAILRPSHKAAGVDGGTCTFSLTAQVASAQSLLNLCRDVKKDMENIGATLSASHASILAWFHALDPASLESLPWTLRSLLSNFKV